MQACQGERPYQVAVAEDVSRGAELYVHVHLKLHGLRQKRSATIPWHMMQAQAQAQRIIPMVRSALLILHYTVCGIPYLSTSQGRSKGLVRVEVACAMVLEIHFFAALFNAFPKASTN